MIATLRQIASGFNLGHVVGVTLAKPASRTVALSPASGGILP